MKPSSSGHSEDDFTDVLSKFLKPLCICCQVLKSLSVYFFFTSQNGTSSALVIPRSGTWGVIVSRFSVVFLFGSMIFLSSCDLRTPPGLTPRPKNNRFHKSFFVKWDSNAKREVGKKHFLCGTSFISTRGKYGQMFLNNWNSNLLSSCNVVFEFTKNRLLVRRVNAALPGDYGNWTVLMSFRIRHYNIENRRDRYGVLIPNDEIETNQFDDFRSMEYVDVEWDTASDLDAGSFPVTIDSIDDDPETDEERGFIGFTANVRAAHPRLKRQAQGSLRVNFIEANATPGFKPSPFHESVAEHVNIVGKVGGRKASGAKFSYIAKWDTSKTHKIYIQNFPEEYQHIAIDSVDVWNKVFRDEIGLDHDLFEPVIGDDVVEFDMRKNTITWIDDRRLTIGGQLGIASPSVNAYTGEILHAGITVWVDIMRSIIENSLPEGGGEGSDFGNFAGNGSGSVQFGFLGQSFVNFDFSSKSPLIGNEYSFNSLGGEISRIYQKDLEFYNRSLVELDQGNVPDELFKRYGRDGDPEDFVRQSKALVTEGVALNEFNSIRRFEYLESKERTKFINSNMNLQTLIGEPQLDETIEFLRQFLEDSGVAAGSEEFTTQLNKLAFAQSALKAKFRNPTVMARAMGQARVAFPELFRDKEKLFKSYVKQTLVHEIGHIIALGHNYKENKLPAEDSVPYETVYKPLVDKHEDHFKNRSSVMGYASSRVSVLLDYHEDVKPQIADIHSLKLIYLGKYPVFPIDRQDGDDYLWLDVNSADGQIYSKYKDDMGREYKIGFLPMCSDQHLALGDDPFCGQSDRGSSAMELVSNYIEDYENFISSALYNLSQDLNTRPFYAQEQLVWEYSLRIFSRVRLFYDHMRSKYDSRIVDEFGARSVSDDFFVKFSEACEHAYNNESISHPRLRELFEIDDREELIDLCMASKKAIKFLGKHLAAPGRGYTQIDKDRVNIYLESLEGEFEVQANKAYGTWVSLSRTPLKLSAGVVLTSPYAIQMRQVGNTKIPVPVPMLARQDSSYHYSTLYPNEYSAALTSGILSSIRFGDEGNGQDRAYIGRLVVALGQLNSSFDGSNDTLVLRGPFKNALASLSSFDINPASLRIEKIANTENERLARAFKATVQEYYTSNSETVEDFYFYVNRQFVINPPRRSLIYVEPDSEIRWYEPTKGSLPVFKVSYSLNDGSILPESDLKSNLTSRLSNYMKLCIGDDSVGGNSNKLRDFFNNDSDPVMKDRFPGFRFSLRIMDNEDDFYISVDEYYKKYYSSVPGEGVFLDNPPDPKHCDNAIQAQNLLVIAAGILNDVFFPGAFQALEKSGGTY